MTSSDARAQHGLAWGLFGVAYFACYFLSTAFPTPLFWYLPLERRFVLGTRTEGLAADFYGRVLWSLIAGAAAYALVRWLARRGSQAIWLSRTLVWSASILLFTSALYVYLLIGRHSQPAPLPPGYVAR